MFTFFKNIIKKVGEYGNITKLLQSAPVTITPPTRQTLVNETERRSYATELLDTYNGFGRYYLCKRIDKTIRNKAISNEMINLAVCLPLLKKFVNSNSRIYNQQPTREFCIEDRKIVKEIPGNKDAENFIVNPELYDVLNGLYSNKVENAIKQAERYSNLLNTVIFKIVTNELGKIDIKFIANDLIQVVKDEFNPERALQIAFVKDLITTDYNQYQTSMVMEVWNAGEKKIPNVENNINDFDTSENEAVLEYEKLFDTQYNDNIFAPFVAFRNTAATNEFWNLQDNDVVECIKNLNLAITELRYLQKFASFGLKYGINIKPPASDAGLDPTGFWIMGTETSSVPGSANERNWEVGEFNNNGRIKEVIEAIIFNLKMLFTMYNIPLDALISSNSVRSAESKQMDNEELFESINAQRNIWTMHEQDLFRTMCAVWNRDNQYQIPKGVEIFVNFEEKTSKEKTNEDWMVEIENNVSSILDWLSELNPDLTRDELKRLWEENKGLNEDDKEDEMEEEGLIGNLGQVPQEVDNEEEVNQSNKKQNGNSPYNN